MKDSKARMEHLRRLIAEKFHIETLNPMQEAVAASRARQIVLLSPTGSGKTLAFAIAMLSRLDFAEKGFATGLVLVPSRELAIQVTEVIRPLAEGLKTVALYGGHQMEIEVSSLRSAAPEIVIATPGRLLDHLDRGTLTLGGLKCLVIDEYDKSLELGFRKQMDAIGRRLPRQRRLTMLTSATALSETPPFISPELTETIDFGNQDSPRARTIVMSVHSPQRDKLETLAALLRSLRNDAPSIVFVNHRESAERVAAWLRRHGVAALLYHGGLDQRKREIAVAALASGVSPVMVATDLAGRGLDIEGLGAVIHYHMPVDEKTWTHRNGRTARADAVGQVYVISGPEEDIPDFVVTDREFYPDGGAAGEVAGSAVLLYIDGGKCEKISRGDVAGFVMKSAGVDPAEVGKITIGSDYSLVAVSSEDAAARVIATARTAKLKGKRVRISRLD